MNVLLLIVGIIAGAIGLFMPGFVGVSLCVSGAIFLCFGLLSLQLEKALEKILKRMPAPPAPAKPQLPTAPMTAAATNATTEQAIDAMFESRQIGTRAS